MTVAHSELSDLLRSAGFGDDSSHLPHTDGFPGLSELRTLQQLSGECTPAEQSAPSHKQAASLPLLCPLPLSLSEPCSLFPALAFPEVSKPRLADGAVAAAGWPSPRDPLPPAICHLPVLHSQGFRGDPKIDLYPGAVSQARPGAGEALCPGRSSVGAVLSSAMELELAVIPSCSWRSE